MRATVRIMSEAIAEKMSLNPDLVEKILQEYGHLMMHGIRTHDMRVEIPSVGYLEKFDGASGTRLRLKVDKGVVLDSNP